MEAYKHIVQYYETDKMGITHHSNYIRWMEEARIDFLKQTGWDYARLEGQGLISPVVEISTHYKASTTFSDEIYIEVSVKDYRGVRLLLHYIMTNADGKVVCEAESMHCFVDKNGRPVRPAKTLPEFDAALKALVTTNTEK